MISGRQLTRAFLFAALLSAHGCFWISHPLDHLHRAEALAAEKKFDDAIGEYRLHMESISERNKTEEWGNPSFYRLNIGDLFLEKGEPQRALEEYLLAEKEGIDPDSITYRIRSLARWYRDKHELDEAIELLQEYRQRDPLLFNSLLDEIVRQKTSEEIQKNDLSR